MSSLDSLLPEHVIEYTTLPSQWIEGLPLGNGDVGVMCWSDGKHLRFSLDASGAWDLRHNWDHLDLSQVTYAKVRKWLDDGDRDAIREAGARVGEGDRARPTKVYLGRLDLDVAFDTDSKLSLDLADASVRGVLRRGEGSHNLHTFVCREQNLLCIRLDPWPEDAHLNLRPFYETSPGLAALGHPEQKIIHRDGLVVAVQHILPDIFFAICWNPKGPEIFVSIAEARDEDSAMEMALKTHPHVKPDSFVQIFDTHAAAWRKFWSQSSVVLPEPDKEFLWYFGLYLLASSARQGCYPPGLQGLWAMDGRNPPWRSGYYADMNVEQMFSAACPTGHLELMDVWCDFAHKALPAAEDITRQLFGTKGAFQVMVLMPEYTPRYGGGWGPTAFSWSNTGWLAQLAWLRWRYSMDTTWLAQRGYPIIRSAFIFFSENLEEEEDGLYHVPLSSSPEYDYEGKASHCKDPNIDLALIRKSCDWVIEMEQALGMDDLTPRAREVHEKLIPYHLVKFQHPSRYVRRGYPEGEYVLALWKDKPLDYSHRHPSHLMAIYPAMDITIDGSEEERRVIEASVGQYMALGQYAWAGHTCVEMMSFAAVIGKPEMAYEFLRNYRDNWIFPNGLHYNRAPRLIGSGHFTASIEDMPQKGQFTTNESCGVACGISDMLVQGWGDIIRVFPSVPSQWPDLMFVDLRTEGAFDVSAIRRDSQTRWVRIVANVDGPCRMRNPFGDGEFDVVGATASREGELLEWPMSAGQTVTLFTQGFENPDLQKEADAVHASFRRKQGLDRYSLVPSSKTGKGEGPCAC